MTAKDRDLVARIAGDIAGHLKVHSDAVPSLSVQLAMAIVDEAEQALAEYDAAVGKARRKAAGP